MFEATAILVVGLCLLVWSADRLVYGAAALARNVGISPLVIGMTILAMGSSAPEMVVSATAALNGKTDTAVGNVLGSNIANIALILGVTALIKPLAISSGILRRELPLMLGVTVIAGAMLWDNYLGFYEGITLVVLFTLFLLIMMKFGKESDKEDPMLTEQEAEIPKGVSNMSAAVWVVVGLALLIFSADMVVGSAVTIAKSFGMSDLVIGLTIVAIGTSLPELAASVAGVLKGEDDLAVGNIIGSNIFNILAVMGIPALLAPSSLNPLAMSRDFYVMLALSVLLFLFAAGRNRTIKRWEGIALLVCFVGYQGFLFTNIAS
ncbi:calcium/sodium antiporter [Enterovibrio makurazakiensis]|uniref:Calcium/sodium antiporter n=1 Tax=Enterovibrio gelatinilyticus TaxID=2899819 RepID=A0ABT5QWX0_9GAMM|nr:calcium/sodium antiporter [Enterovibrio sp. ZSDZ42]MDD1792026.1 calcium/sodium antiporter [Enterovibrio sp. ZSDZ42]